ncbi:MAG: PaaI family thioesterase [Acidimicrobiales bacterium]
MSPTKPWSGGGRESLADAVRRLMTTVVAAAAPPEVLRRAAESAGRLADELGGYLPAPGREPRARFAEGRVEQGRADSMAEAMPFDMIVGSCNPVAPPISIVFAPPKAIGTVRFTPQYEGAPGCVHGAALAGAFDIILTAANFMAMAAGPTVELTIRYRKPTLIAEPAVFEGWVTERTGRRIHSAGRLLQGDVVTVEATGVFVEMERSRIQSLHRRPQRRRPSEAAPETE